VNLNDLGTTPLASDGVDVNNLPEQRGQTAPPPQPGRYRFKLPVLKPEAFAKIVTKEQGDRVMVKFRDEHPLTIIQTPPAMKDEYLNTPFETVVNNIPRKRGKGDDAPKASDWDYINKALKEPARPTNNADYAKKLIAQSQKAGGAEFSADIEWSWHCSPTRDARFDDGNGGVTTVPALQEDGVTPVGVDPNTNEPTLQKGCGKRIYQSAVTKVDGKYPLTITCPDCGANVRAFPDLSRIAAE
jgi:hypothetical protein